MAEPTFDIHDSDGCILEDNVWGYLPRVGERMWTPGGVWATVIAVEYHVNQSYGPGPTRCLPTVTVRLDAEPKP